MFPSLLRRALVLSHCLLHVSGWTGTHVNKEKVSPHLLVTVIYMGRPVINPVSLNVVHLTTYPFIRLKIVATLEPFERQDV